MKNLLIIMICLVQLSACVQQSKSIVSDEVYQCPMNCEDGKTYDKKGICPLCRMELKLFSRTDPENQPQSKRMSIAFYLQNGVEVLDFTGPMEVFSVSGFNVFTISKTTEPIISQGILKVTPDYSIENAPKADIIAVFGGNFGVASNDKEVISWIKKEAENVDYLFSVCTGIFIFGQAGLLDNQTVTTFHQSIEFLRNNFPETKVLSDVRFVDNGKLITTAGISAGIDGALHLVEKIYGAERAKQTSIYMEYDKWVPNEGLIIKSDSPVKIIKTKTD